MLVYLLDTNAIYTGTATVDPMAALPPCSTTPPPTTTGTEVAQFVATTWCILPEYPVTDYSAQNKQQASELLYATDWTTIPDVSDPELSDPYLTNTGEFAAYRSLVRAIAVTPPSTPAVFPQQPQAIWSNS